MVQVQQGLHNFTDKQCGHQEGLELLTAKDTSDRSSLCMFFKSRKWLLSGLLVCSFSEPECDNAFRDFLVKEGEILQGKFCTGQRKTSGGHQICTQYFARQYPAKISCQSFSPAGKSCQAASPVGLSVSSICQVLRAHMSVCQFWQVTLSVSKPKKMECEKTANVVSPLYLLPPQVIKIVTATAT